MCEEQECWWAQLQLAAPRSYIYTSTPRESSAVSWDKTTVGLHGEGLKSPVLGWVHTQEHLYTALSSHHPSVRKVDLEHVPSLQAPGWQCADLPGFCVWED